MRNSSDQELVEELHRRLEQNARALHDLRALSGQLETTTRRLQESEALKGRFLANIRNEINNPLAAIIGLAARLAAGCDEAETRAIGRMVYAEATTLDFHLENIFVAAELEAGEALPAPARTDAAAVVTEALGELAQLAAKKGISLRQHGPPSRPFVTDPRMLSLMARNLIANAVEFSPEGSSVEVEVGGNDGRLRIVVGDRGPGIPPERREEIFERFRQLETGSTKRHPGQGLGLSVTRAVAELLQGSIAVEDRPGGGSRFTLTVPAGAGDGDTLALNGGFLLFDHAERC